MIIFDIDGTLSIVGERKKYARLIPVDWNSFHAGCGEDEVNVQVQILYKTLFEAGHTIRLVTARPEKWRQATLNWLWKNEIYIRSSALYMRKDHDYRDSSIIKAELVKDFRSKIELVFEDDDQVVAMWRDMGITCLQVKPGKF